MRYWLEFVMPAAELRRVVAREQDFAPRCETLPASLELANRASVYYPCGPDYRLVIRHFRPPSMQDLTGPVIGITPVRFLPPAP